MIDKSLNQYQQNLLEGTTLGALRKAGIIDVPVQKNVVRDPIKPIAMQTPKNIKLPESKTIVPEKTSFQPAAKIKAAPPTAGLLKQSPGGAGLGSFDPKRSEALAKDFYDQATAEKDSYLDKHISDFLNRPVTAAAATDQGVPNYLPSSLAPLTTIGGDFAQNLSGITPLTPLTPLAISSKTLAALPSEGEGKGNSYSDTQIQNIYESGDSDTKNFITGFTNKTTDLIKENSYMKDIIKNSTTSFAQTKAGNFVAKELGLGAIAGPIGMLLGWAVGKAINYFRGDKAEKDEEGKTPPWAISLTGQDSKEDTGENTDFEQDLIDQGAGVQIAPGQPVVAPGEIPVTQEEIDKYNEDTITTSPSVSVPVHIGPSNEGGGRDEPTGPTSQSESDYGYGSDAGWWAKGGRVKLTKGGRVDKALTGRSRDI
jgi:hypothetical protein